MTDKNKPMSFTGWWNLNRGFNHHNLDVVQIAETAWNDARIGYIPADRAIEVPEVGEWPEWANCVVVHYGGCDVQVSNIATIPRPVPAWTPKVGDAVFAYNGGMPWVAKVIPEPEGTKVSDFYVVCSDGQESWWGKDGLKPFDHAKIGLPWEEL